MEFDAFLALTDIDVAAIVRRAGPRVVVFPINGTRRWYLLEHGKGNDHAGAADPRGFLDRILDRYIELFALFFDHGVSTLMSPILGPDIAARDAGYRRMIHTALEEIAGGERFGRFYERYDVRIRFYGDYHGYLRAESPEVPERIRQVQSETAGHIRHKLFWGMFAHDAVEMVGRLAIEHHETTGRAPGRDELVTRYYGEFIPPADIFIGMLPPRVFDFPLLDTGHTALYFTTAPSPYLDRETLRRILFDFLYVQPDDETYDMGDPETWQAVQSFYREHLRGITGAGRLAAGNRIWLPD